MRRFYLRPDKTVICAMVGWDSVQKTINEGRQAEADGAQALVVGIERLRPECRTQSDFARIVSSFTTPVMAHFYRHDSWSQQSADEETRANVLLEAVRAGVGMVDLMGDQFAPAADERTRDKAAIARQKAFIDEAHSLGAQVIMSSHPSRFMTCAEVVDQLKDFADRGADVVKLVGKADTEDEFLETIRTTIALNHELSVPFVYLTGGRFAYAHRMFGLSLGCAISFTFGRYGDFWNGDMPMPLLANMRSVQDNVIWHLNAVSGI